MSNQIKNHIVLKRESVWGTPVVPDKTLPVDFTGGIQTQQDIQMIISLKSRLAKNDAAFVGNRTHEGDYEMAAYPDNIGFLFLSAFGGLVTSTIEPAVVFKHDFTEAETKPSLTIEQKIGENIRRYAGSLVHTLKVSGSPGEVVMIAPSIKAKTQAAEVSPVTPAPTTVAPLDFSQAVIKIDTVALDQIESFEFEYTSGLDLKHALASNDPKFIFLAGSEIKGSLEGFLDATTKAALMDKYLSKTFINIELLVTGGVIGAGSTFQLELIIPKAVITTAETPLGDDFNLVTIEFEGIFDPVTAKLCSAFLQNLTSSYA